MIARAFRPIIAAGALLAAQFIPALPLHAAPPVDSKLAELQSRDAQLFAVGWRLVTANAAFCEGASGALGLNMLDAGAFASPDRVRRQLGLSGDLAIGAVAPGSPAAQASLLANDTLLAIGGQQVASTFPARKPAWQRLIAVTAALDAAAAAGPVTLTFARGDTAARTVTLAGVPACPTRFEVLDSGGRAMAEGTRVIFGRSFVGFAYPEAEFAAAVAHELAHNLLRHRAALDIAGRSLGNVRASEREADRLMPWLLANAGYDPAAALSFMERWGPRHGGGLFRKRTHEGWDERRDAIAVEVAKVQSAMAATGVADWARDFLRDPLPKP